MNTSSRPGVATNVWAAGTGAPIDVPGLPTQLTVSGTHTQGAYCVAEQVIAPGMLYPPHVHANEDQYAYVLEGSLWFRLGDDDFELACGASIFRPRGVVHATWNATSEPARMLEITNPGNFDEYFRELASGACPASETARRWNISMATGADEIAARYQVGR